MDGVRATAGGTAAFAERACQRVDLRTSLCHFRRAGALHASSIALLLDAATADELLPPALDYGINVVQAPLGDEAQAAAGRAIAECIRRERCAREELVVTALGGVMASLAPLTLGSRLARIEDDFIRRDLLTWSELTPSLHCLAPRYLAQEVAAAAARLAVGAVDFYLIDRPEAHRQQLSRAGFADRMRRAFAALEALCADGTLAAFGIATADASPAAAEFVGELVGWAREVGGDGHHLRALQTAVGLSSTPATLALLDGARRHGLFTFAVHEPLAGATLQPFFRNELAGLASDEQRALQLARSAGGVGTVVVHPADVFELQEAAEVARIPPAAAETVQALIQATA
jgi:aryl-alcohol dehydrogenase-like predicted oxidoreductase